ncbi:MAG: hypothetical protein JWM11_4869 [Planctomycetaceae bacterium]|nr:hypothetical protein [Planctomycetaceae bacterium]
MAYVASNDPKPSFDKVRTMRDSVIPEDRMTLAFYGVCHDSHSVQDFYLQTLEFFTKCLYTPDYLAVHGNGHTSKLGSFKRIDARLRKTGFGGVEGFEIVTALPNPKTRGRDFVAKCMCHTRDNGYLAIAVPGTTREISQLLEFSTSIISNLKPEYGIGYLRDLKYGPTGFAIGLGGAFPDAVTAGRRDGTHNITAWSSYGMKHALYRKGILRDIYEWNYLSPSQLQNKVGTLTLEKWITHDSSRGMLRKLGPGAIWDLPETAIVGVRSSLTEAKLISDYQDFIGKRGSTCVAD